MRLAQKYFCVRRAIILLVRGLNGSCDWLLPSQNLEVILRDIDISDIDISGGYNLPNFHVLINIL